MKWNDSSYFVASKWGIPLFLAKSEKGWRTRQPARQYKTESKAQTLRN
jgi:hypothetical protein